MHRVSTYWKCQMAGWGTVYLILMTGNFIDSSVVTLPARIFWGVPLIVALTGIVVSHNMRSVIRGLRIFQKPYNLQVIYFLFITIICAIIFSLLIYTCVTLLQLDFYVNNEIKKKMSFLTKIFPMTIQGIVTFFTWNLIYFLYHYIQKVREKEREKVIHEKQLLELEAKALRAQMNPHFIFNCMNSIKSLIQKDDKEKAATYLTTFSKLIRTIFQNSDKREITLFDEIETCRLYTQLESMRFDKKFSYAFHVDEALDLKSVMVPALIIQPFIENSIWHGIMPREAGGRVSITVRKTDHTVSCIIDDDGIGRETSKQNRFKGDALQHQSKGVHLTQARLSLDNLLNERNANVEIRDKREENGKPVGTTVILTFKEY